MEFGKAAVILIIAYLFGAIPFGLLIVKWKTGQDVRKIESGRTGGTNVMRAAGFAAGFTTALLDILKGAGAAWVARWLLPDWPLIHALAPIAAIIGHNYSIFLAERDEQGRLRLRGGAGGATSLGGALGLWWPAGLIILPLGYLIFWGIGYASVTTMSVAFMAIVIFTVRYLMVGSPWEYVLYGVLAEILVMWALRPNIRRLLNGTERLHGWRAKRRARLQEQGRQA